MNRPTRNTPLHPNASRLRVLSTMNLQHFAILVLASAGCRATPEPRDVPPDHPANPRAAAADFAPAPSPFDVTTTYAMPEVRASGLTPHGAPGSEPGSQPGGSGDVPVQYTCPMHPHVVQDHPGNCPECGMALRPVAAHEHGGEGSHP